jgi:hypothetical protein
MKYNTTLIENILELRAQVKEKKEEFKNEGGEKYLNLIKLKHKGINGGTEQTNADES